MSWQRRLPESEQFFDLIKASGFRCKHLGRLIFEISKVGEGEEAGGDGDGAVEFTGGGKGRLAALLAASGVPAGSTAGGASTSPAGAGALRSNGSDQSSGRGAEAGISGPSGETGPAQGDGAGGGQHTSSGPSSAGAADAGREASSATPETATSTNLNSGWDFAREGGLHDGGG